MNVGLVFVTFPGCTSPIELRPDAVSINDTLMTMLRIQPFDEEPSQVSPILLARYISPHGWKIVDPMTGGFDGTTWVIESNEPRPFTFVVRPYEKEHIWVDPGYSDVDASRSLRELYAQLHAINIALVCEGRWARTSTDKAVIELHTRLCKSHQETVARLEDEIVARRERLGLA